MSGQTFSSFLPCIRDRGLSLTDSWAVRYFSDSDSNEPRDEYYDLWSTKPIWELTAEDLVWCLVAAAQDPFVTHLNLRVFIGNRESCPNPEETFECLIDSLEDSFGFYPSEYGADISGQSGDESVLISLFSANESERICTFLERKK